MLNKFKNISRDKKQLASNFVSLTLLQIFTYALPLITLPYLVRVLGTEKYGLVVFAQSFMVFFNILVDYGFGLSATREISINRDNKAKVTEIFSSVMEIKFMLVLLSFVSASVIIFSFDKFRSDSVLYYLTFLYVIGQAMFPIWYFQGMEQMKYITVVNIISKLIFTIAIFIFVRSEADYLLVPILNGFGFLVGGAYSLYLIRKIFNQDFTLQTIKTLNYYFKDGTQFFFSRLSSVGYSNINTFLSGVLLSSTFVAYYHIADKVISIALAIFDPIVQSIYPYFSKKYDPNIFLKIFAFVVCASMIVTLLVFFVSDFISLFLFNEVNYIFLKVLYVLLFMIPISALYVMLGAPLLLARGFKREFNLSIIYGFLIHLIILSLIYVLFLSNIAIGEELLLYFAISLVVSKFIVLLIRLYYVYINKLHIKG